MTKEFRYRPPLLFGIAGLGMLYVSFLLLPGIGYGENGFQFLTGFFGLSSLAFGVYFSVSFISRVGSGHLRVSTDFIEIPGKWRTRTTVTISEIEEIKTIESYDLAIEIQNKGRHFKIDGKLMTKSDFQELKVILKNCDLRVERPVI